MASDNDIDPITEALRTLIRESCGDVPAVFDAPAKDNSALTIHLTLVGLVPNTRQPVQILRRYLVCATGPDQTASASMMEQMLFRAMQTPGMTVEPDGVPLDLWPALGIPLKPGFLLRVPSVLSRKLETKPRVQEIKLDLSPMGTLRGQVLTAQGTPLRNCLVEVPSRKLRAKTDSDGAFEFASLSPLASYRIRVQVGDNAADLLAEASPGSGFGSPLILKVPPAKKEA